MIPVIIFSTQLSAQKPAPKPELQLFNLGRIRSFGGVSFSPDGRSLFLTQRVAAQPGIRLQIAVSQWEHGNWSEPRAIPCFKQVYYETNPVCSPDGQRLYFCSTAPRPDSTQEADLNIWYLEKNETGWGQPIFAAELNSTEIDILTAVSSDGSVYYVSNRPGGKGGFDIYASRQEHGQWTAPENVVAWNTPESEEHVTLSDKHKVAVIARGDVRDSIQLLLSTFTGLQWSAPQPFDFEGRNNLSPYYYRKPTLSADGSALYLVSSSHIFHLSLRDILRYFRKSAGLEKGIPAHVALPVPPRRKGEYELFANGVIRTNNGLTFSGDGKTLYVSNYLHRREPHGQLMRIFEYRYKNKKWTGPLPAPFSAPDTAAVMWQYHPVLTPDGQTVFFNSPAPDSITSKNDLWMSTKHKNGQWSKPKTLEVVATDAFDDYASITRKNTLYFRSNRSGGKGEGDIYRCRWQNGVWTTPENVPELNSKWDENDVCVDSGERFIVFNRYINESNSIDLFISFHQHGTWSSPVALDRINHPMDWELTPTLSPDGRYLYCEIDTVIYRWRTDEFLTAYHTETAARPDKPGNATDKQKGG